MTDSNAVLAFWNKFLESNKGELPDGIELYEAFTFGTSPASATWLASLVMSGAKTATSESLRYFEESGRRPPQAGDYSIVLDGDGTPLCVIQTTEARIIPFNTVDASFAYDYGEGDRTLDWWLENLREYYVEQNQRKGWDVDDTLPIVCERFRIVWRPDGSNGASHGS